VTTQIQSLADLPDQPQGIVFWWSNILRAYQLRVYLPGGPLLPQVHLTHEEVEIAAQTLANQHHLPIYEIKIERIHHTLLNQQ